ncbi:ABC superfamily ATP binding cassette transporter, partial [Prevotella dentalis DSM 3688]
PAAAPAAAKAPAPTAVAGDARQNYQEHKERQKKIRRAERSVEESEKKIARLEARLKELDTLLMHPDNAANMELVGEYTSAQAALDRENDAWLTLSEALETLRAAAV